MWIMRLIDTDALETHECYDGEWFEAVYKDDIDAAPTIDAVPVVHGKWVEDTISSSDGKYGMYGHRCSACHRSCMGREEYAYCPKCGAKMDGDTDGNG